MLKLLFALLLPKMFVPLSNSCISSAHLFQVKLENIGGKDIVEGKPKLTLGLIWTIILRLQVSFQPSVLVCGYHFDFLYLSACMSSLSISITCMYALSLLSADYRT